MLSEREKIVLRFLDDGRMGATVKQIGVHLQRHGMCPGGYQAVGAGIVASMRKKGLVMRLSDLRAWRITKDGRNALANSSM